MTRLVPISSYDVHAIIDDCDAVVVLAHKWSRLHKKGWYLRSRTFLLHRLITGAAAGQVVDHINGDALDNRRSNLRICSNNENLLNRAKNKNTRYAYKGVGFCAGRFTASIQHENKAAYLGRYDTVEEAAIAYNNAALRLHGSFARLNVIGSNCCSALLLDQHDGAESCAQVDLLRQVRA